MINIYQVRLTSTLFYSTFIIISQAPSTVAGRIWKTASEYLENEHTWRMISIPARIKVSRSLDSHVRRPGDGEVIHQERDLLKLAL